MSGNMHTVGGLTGPRDNHPSPIAVAMIEDDASTAQHAIQPPLAPTEPVKTVDIVHISDISSVSSESGSSDPDEPCSRKARKLALKFLQRRQICQKPQNLQDFYRPVTKATYVSTVDALLQRDVMDLRNVIAAAVPKDLLGSGDNSTSDSSDSQISSSTPEKRRNGYVIDDFVVDSSEDSDDE
jgi:hypothetical protein